MKILLDIETDYAHSRIWVCVTKNIETGEVIVWKNPEGLQAYLNEATQLIAHNGIGFDFPQLKKHWNMTIKRKQVFDTLVLSRLLNPNRENGHSLAELGKTAGNNKIDFSDYDLIESSLEEMIEYCIQDVHAMHTVYDMLMAEKEANGFSDECVDLEMQVACIIKRQEENGFTLDVAHANTLLAILNSEISSIDEAMQQRWPEQVVERVSEKTGKPLKPEVIRFNVGSRQQVADKLLELGWKPSKLTPGGNPAVDEDTLSNCDIPEAKMVLRYLMLSKRVSQIEQWLEAVVDGKVHGRVNTIGAVTGRMTHSKPNMAQVPNAGSEYGPECRQCFTAGKGRKLVGADASGLELRMLAHYMGDTDYVTTVTEGSSKLGTDVHTKNQVAAGLPTRDAAKTFIYAFLYGAGDAKIGSIVGGGAKQGAKLRHKFLEQTPALANLITKVGNTYTSKGNLPGLDGRRLWVRSEHAALNTLLQGAGAIVMKKALVILDSQIHKNKWDAKFVANVHDEWQIDCAEDCAEAVGQASVEAIREAGVAFKLQCPLDGEYKVGFSWRDTH